MIKKPGPYIIAVTGAESTGKSILTQQLAKHFNAPFYSEFAREYISGLNRQYNISDVEFIAKKQIEQYNEAINSNHKLIFFDTWLLITKVWFEVVFSKAPDWIESNIKNSKISGFILNDIDIPWEPDPVRENGGENRIILHNKYLKNLEKSNFNFYLNSGFNSKRINNAIKFVTSIII
ncbi:MAG: ATP-binding protein [Mariniphaga sp.]|nr:ATP-binding protein [Mariniphaga sp.]